MKQVILSIVGTLVIVYVVMIGFSVFSAQTRKNNLENSVGRIIEAALEEQHPPEKEELIKQRVVDEIVAGLDEDGEVSVLVQAFDLQKGIISVKVEQSFLQFNGKTRTVSCEKTVIVEKKQIEEERVIVKFLVGDEVYKEYQLVKGQACPVPTLPEEGYLGWKEMNADSWIPLEEIKEVWEDMIYVAIFE